MRVDRNRRFETGIGDRGSGIHHATGWQNGKAPQRFLWLAGLLLVGSVLHAAGPRDSLIVSPAWLAQHLNDRDLVLLHVGDKAEYEAKHIPGASTRIIFTLDYAGLGERASLLDGGMDAWIRDAHTLTTVVPEPRIGTLSALKVRPLIVDGDYVRAQLGKPGVAIVDSRASLLYEGTTTGGSKEAPHKTGHIAGAVSVPYTAITDQQLKVRSPEDLAALFKDAGVKPGDTVITYCHIGQQATATLFAARTLGYKVFLYDGSFEDWSRRADAPVENPAK